MTNKIKVLVADSSQIYAFGLYRSLSEDERIEVLNHIYSGRYVIDVIGQAKPDIILVDLELINNDDSTIVEMLQELYPEVKIIVLVPREFIQYCICTGILSVDG